MMTIESKGTPPPSTEDMTRATMARVFADLMRHFMECSDVVQSAILEMAQIVNDPESDQDEKEMALATIQEALFPKRHNGNLGADITELDPASGPELSAVIAELDAEEAEFATRVQALMDARGITQVELANKAGVGQPAISMMLARNCRPQKRTIERLATALGVAPQDLWPH